MLNGFFYWFLSLETHPFIYSFYTIEVGCCYSYSIFIIYKNVFLYIDWRWIKYHLELDLREKCPIERIFYLKLYLKPTIPCQKDMFCKNGLCLWTSFRSFYKSSHVADVRVVTSMPKLNHSFCSKRSRLYFRTT